MRMNHLLVLLPRLTRVSVMLGWLRISHITGMQQSGHLKILR